jgi:hypothetical protein
MKRRFSSVHLLTAVFTVLLVVVTDEIALAETRSDEKELLAISLIKDSERAIYNWLEKDVARERVFVKRAKKSRTAKTLLHYLNTHHHKGALFAPAKTGNYQYIFSRHPELLLLYCLLQI